MAAIGMLYTVLAWFWIIISPEFLMSIFTDDVAMINAGVESLKIYFFGFFSRKFLQVFIC